MTTDYTDCTDKEKLQKMRSSIISKSAKSVVDMIRMIFRLRISGFEQNALAHRNRVRGMFGLRVFRQMHGENAFLVLGGDLRSVGLIGQRE